MNEQIKSVVESIIERLTNLADIGDAYFQHVTLWGVYDVLVEMGGEVTSTVYDGDRPHVIDRVDLTRGRVTVTAQVSRPATAEEAARLDTDPQYVWPEQRAAELSR